MSALAKTSGKGPCALLAAALLLAAPKALAEDATARAPVTVETPPPAHQLSAYATTQASFFLSPIRTRGGLGGGLGIRDTLQDRFILQADVSYLLLAGNSLNLRVAAGVQARGTYAPAVFLTLSTFFGDQLTFLDAQHPEPPRGPTVALELTLAPLRFSVQGMQISLLELGLGASPEFPGLGFDYHLGFVEVGVPF